MDKPKTIHISIEDELAAEYVKENEEYFQEIIERMNEKSRQSKSSNSFNIYERDTNGGFKR